MKRVHVTTRGQWRQWLAENHDKEPDGIWLIFQKKDSGKPTLQYEESVEEALCFGWIDSIIKKIDSQKYCRKFTPRKHNSAWSSANKKRVEKLVKNGTMTRFGLAKVKAAKKSGRWDKDPRPTIDSAVPKDLASALAKNKRAREFFDELAPSYRRRFIGWIVTAKQPQTRAKRLQESLALLAKREKLGLK